MFTSVHQCLPRSWKSCGPLELAICVLDSLSRPVRLTGIELMGTEKQPSSNTEFSLNLFESKSPY